MAVVVVVAVGCRRGGVGLGVGVLDTLRACDRTWAELADVELRVRRRGCGCGTSRAKMWWWEMGSRVRVRVAWTLGPAELDFDPTTTDFSTSPTWLRKKRRHHQLLKSSTPHSLRHL